LIQSDINFYTLQKIEEFYIDGNRNVLRALTLFSEQMVY